MKLGIYVSFWSDGRYSQVSIMEAMTIDEINIAMNLGSMWENEIKFGPIDVSQLDNLKLTLFRIEG